MASGASSADSRTHLLNLCFAHLLTSVNTPTMQCVDVVLAAVHKATNEPVVTKDDGGHLCDVLIALVFSYVGAMIYQTGH